MLNLNISLSSFLGLTALVQVASGTGTLLDTGTYPGGGAFSPASVIEMDESGVIRSSVTPPTNLSIDYNPAIRIDGSSENLVGFTINVNFSAPLPSPSQQAAFTDAAAAWMGRITGYRGVMSVPSITINAAVAPDDGPGGRLGSAGPTNALIQDEDGSPGGNSFVLTTQGQMSFDSADIDALETSGSLGDVIEHEMGHVLGIGTLWSAAAIGAGGPGRQEHYVDGSGQYTGPAAVQQWQTEFGQADAFVPVELGGGPGTADGHWNEVDGGAGLTGITQVATGNDLRNELMTGWLNGPNFVSNMTLASLEDIGYTTTAVLIPEPAGTALAGLGLLLLGARRRRK